MFFNPLLWLDVFQLPLWYAPEWDQIHDSCLDRVALDFNFSDFLQACLIEIKGS